METNKYIDKEYDVVFHLVGEQRVPNYFGIENIKSQKHIFVQTDDFKSDYIEPFIRNSLLDIINVGPYDIKDVEIKIRNYINKEKRNNQTVKIAFNLTGGTKFMYAGAYNVAKEIDADSYYINTYNKEIIMMNKDLKYDIRKIQSNDVFIGLHSKQFTIHPNGFNSLSKNSIVIAAFLYNNSKILETIKKEYDRGTKEQYKGGVYNKGLRVNYDNEKKFTITLDNISETYNIPFQQFITGVWFEHYVFSLLLNLKNKYEIYDLRSGLIIKDSQDNIKTHEYDAVFTDGYILYTVECKSGKNESKDYAKMNESTKLFGGTFGKVIYINQQYVKSIDNKAQQNKDIYIYEKIQENLEHHLQKLLKKK